MEKSQLSPNYILYLCIVAIAIFLVYASASFVENRFVAPVDDAYIHYQYAYQASEGRLWQYNDDDGITTGATSFIYPFLLATALRLGLPKEQIFLFALAIGFLALIMTCFTVWKLTRLLLHEEKGATKLATYLATLFLCTGAFQWGFFNGMETGLFSLTLVAALLAYYQEKNYLFAFLTATSAFIRPEGTILAMVAGALFVIELAINPTRQRLRTGMTLLAILAISTAPFLFNWWFTGELAATGAQAKSWFGNIPFRTGDILRSVTREIIRIVSRLSLGIWADPSWSIPPGVLPLAIVGWLQLIKTGRHRFAVLTIAWTGVGILLSATLITSLWHVGRYQLPYLIPLYAIAVLGVVKLCQRLFGNNVIILRLTGAALFAIGLWTTTTAVGDYASASWSMNSLQITAGEWIDENLPVDANVAILDAGAIRYFGNRSTVDVIGLTTVGFAPLWRAGMGAVYEELENMPQRPGYFVVFPNVSGIPYFEHTNIFSQEVHRVVVPDFSQIGAVESTKIIYAIDWSLAHHANQITNSSQRQLVEGLDELLRIDVADARSEQIANLDWWEGESLIGHATELFQLPTAGSQDAILIDGGRLITGGVAFDTEAIPGQPVTIVARTHSIQSNAFEVYANGKKVGVWNFLSRPGEWVESSYIIDGSFIEDNQLYVELVLADQTTYATLFHIWVYGDAPSFWYALDEIQPEAIFAERIHLLEYSIVLTTEHIDLDTVWQSPLPNMVDAKIFVHVYDSAGEIVAQYDGYASNDTRPPFAWHPNELIQESYRLPLPPFADSGPYEVAIGLYNPHNGGRLQIETLNDHFVSEERLFIPLLDVDQ